MSRNLESDNNKLNLYFHFIIFISLKRKENEILVILNH